MIRLYFALLLTFTVTSGYSQKTPDDYLQEANNEERNMHNDAALTSYRYIIGNHPGNVMCPYVYYRMGGIYAMQGRDADAIKAMRTALAGGSKRAAPSVSMARYYGYQNGAATTLCRIYEQRGNYDSALYFLGLCDTVYPMGSGCGNAAGYEKSAIILHYTSLLRKAGRTREAERTLLSWFPYGPYGFKDSIMIKLNELLKQYEQPKQLKQEVDNAINNYYFDTVYDTRYVQYDTAVFLCINFMDVKIRYYYSGQTKDYYDGLFRLGSPLEIEAAIGGIPPRDKIIAGLKKTDLYTMIRKL